MLVRWGGPESGWAGPGYRPHGRGLWKEYYETVAKIPFLHQMILGKGDKIRF